MEARVWRSTSYRLGVLFKQLFHPVESCGSQRLPLPSEAILFYPKRIEDSWFSLRSRSLAGLTKISWRPHASQSSFGMLLTPSIFQCWSRSCQLLYIPGISSWPFSGISYRRSCQFHRLRPEPVFWILQVLSEWLYRGILRPGASWAGCCFRSQRGRWPGRSRASHSSNVSLRILHRILHHSWSSIWPTHCQGLWQRACQ